MINSKFIKDGIYWVGALDPDLRIFDIIMYAENGTTYNSYLVKGTEKTAVFETVKEHLFDDFIKNIKEVGSPTDIDYIVVNHTEPDHAGSIAALIEINPDAVVVGSATAVKFLNNIINKPFNSIVVKDGDTIDLGGKTIKFIMAPFLHWPDTMYSYIVEDNVLITCDSFGAHYSSDKLFNDLIGDVFLPDYKYYYDCIMGPFKPFVLQALDKIKDLNIDVICPGHGPILRSNLEKYINLYREWSTVTVPEIPTIVIPYVSAYGYTKQLAEYITQGIKSAGNIEVKLFDMVYDKKEEALEAINNASGVLFGSPTILGDALPPIMELLIHINPIINKNLFAGAFGSYGWSGEAVPNIESRLCQLRLKVPVSGLRVIFKPSEDDLQNAFNFGKQFAEAVLEKLNK